MLPESGAEQAEIELTSSIESRVRFNMNLIVGVFNRAFKL